MLAAVLGMNLIASAIVAVFVALINFEIKTIAARPAVAAGPALDDDDEEDI